MSGLIQFFGRVAFQPDGFEAQNRIFLGILRRIDGFQGILYRTGQKLVGYWFVVPTSGVHSVETFLRQGVLKGLVQIEEQTVVLATHVYLWQSPHLAHQRRRCCSTHGNNN